MELNKKLRDTAYVPMELEYGIIPENNYGEKNTNRFTHGRKWQRFNLQELLPLQKKYILSSSVGMGKTTFVYHLARELLELDYLPLVFSCQEVEAVKPNTENQFIAYFAETYNQYSRKELKKGIIQEIIEVYANKILFLFDGLDQIRSDDYAYIANIIEKICSNHFF